MSIRNHLAKKKLHLRAVKGQKALKLKVWYPSQGKYITVGYGNQRDIIKLSKLYSNDQIQIDFA